MQTPLWILASLLPLLSRRYQGLPAHPWLPFCPETQKPENITRGAQEIKTKARSRAHLSPGADQLLYGFLPRQYLSPWGVPRTSLTK